MPLVGAVGGRQESALIALLALDLSLFCTDLFRACWGVLLVLSVLLLIVGCCHHIATFGYLHDFSPNLSVCIWVSSRAQPV